MEIHVAIFTIMRNYFVNNESIKEVTLTYLEFDTNILKYKNLCNYLIK